MNGRFLCIGLAALSAVGCASHGALASAKVAQACHRSLGSGKRVFPDSPDKLTITGKLAQTAFAPVKPVDGRNVDLQDVLFSWDRFKKGGNQRSDPCQRQKPAHLEA